MTEEKKKHPGGRPRHYDYVKEAQDLEEWSLLEDSINLYAFVDRKPYLANQLAEFAAVCPEFSSALKKAKNRIALRRERMLCEGKLHIAAWGRSSRLYDSLLKEQEDKDKDDDIARKQKLVQSQIAVQEEQAQSFVKHLIAQANQSNDNPS